MKKLVIAFIGLLFSGTYGFAQFTTVSYDMNRNWFNEGQELPAEKAMIFKGVLPENVQTIEINILSDKNSNVLYMATGDRQSGNEFAIPVSYKLRSSNKYDFRMDYFSVLPAKKQEQLKAQIKATLDTYIDVNLEGNKSIKLLKKSKKTVKEMTEILKNVLKNYRNSATDWQLEFSDVVKLKLDQLDKAKLDKGYEKGADKASRQAVREKARQQLVSGLKEQIYREAEQMLDTEILVLSETRVVDNYPTTKKENSLAINVGYGGVYLSGDLDDLSYGAAPYAGLAFPLGNSILGSKFLSNTSLTIGVFLDKFEDENENEVKGFLIDQPLYLGLDHKLFKFIRVNAGATFLEGMKLKDNAATSSKNIMIRPFIGLSARIDLSVGLGK